MLLLTSISDLIQVITSAARTIDVHASFLDFEAATGVEAVTPVRTDTAISTATTTTIVGSPSDATTYRNVKHISIRNKDASSCDITVQHYNGTITVQLIKTTLQAGQELFFFSTAGWFVLDTSGSILSSTNLTQLAGTAVDVNSGNKSNGTLRVVLATDQPQLTLPVIVTGNIADGAAMGSTNIAALIAHASAVRQIHLQDKMYHLNMDLEGHLRTRTRSENMLGDVSIAPRNNQIEINFSIAFASLPITNTPTGTGSATQANGQATYSSGGTSGGRAIGVTNQSLVYRPGHIFYAEFTAGFSTGGTGAGFQRIGPYTSGADGFFIGYEGGTFNFTQLKAGALTSIARASWNGDPLDGSTSSVFTSGGSPVAIDLTKINIWKIEGSWFGTAPVKLEVLSPDAEWVLCHAFRFPNTLTVPYAATTNWALTIDVQSASATPVSISTPCLAMGTQDQNFGITDTITDNSLAVLGRSVLVGHTTAGGGAYVNVKVNPSGALTVDATGSTGLVLTTSSAVIGHVIVDSGSVTTSPHAVTAPAYSQAVISSSANPVVVVAAVGGQIVRIYRIFFANAGTATNITFEDSTPTAMSGAFPLLANGQFSADGNGDPLFVTASGKGFSLVNSASQQISGIVWYTQA